MFLAGRRFHTLCAWARVLSPAAHALKTARHETVELHANLCAVHWPPTVVAVTKGSRRCDRLLAGAAALLIALFCVCLAQLTMRLGQPAAITGRVRAVDQTRSGLRENSVFWLAGRLGLLWWADENHLSAARDCSRVAPSAAASLCAA